MTEVIKHIDFRLDYDTVVALHNALNGFKRQPGVDELARLEDFKAKLRITLESTT